MSEQMSLYDAVSPIRCQRCGRFRHADPQRPCSCADPVRRVKSRIVRCGCDDFAQRGECPHTPSMAS